MRVAATKGHAAARRAFSFWALAGLLFAFLFGASAPSPLYPIYQREFGFSAITITAIYAAYAASGLVGLLLSGRLSDYIGRRPVVASSLVIQLLAMATFIAADSELLLYLARLLQGLATGAAIGALSAWLVDLQPSTSPRQGALVASTSVMLGLGMGGMGAGLIVQLAPEPLRLVYWLLAAVYLAGLLAMPLLLDVVPRRPGWRAAVRPEIGIPHQARAQFLAIAPSVIATWALGGLFLSLGPPLAIGLSGSPSPIVGGLVIVALLGTAALASVVVRNAAPHVLLARGSVLLIVGVTLALAGVALDSLVGLFAGSVVAGLGLGPSFAAGVRSVTSLAQPTERGALVAAIYILLYVSFSAPAVAAGFATTVVGLRTATYGYGIVVIVLAAITAYLVVRSNGRPARAGLKSR